MKTTLEIVSQQGDRDLAMVYVARLRDSDSHAIEFVDARDPSIPPDKKRVVIISTQFGCPIACPICDAGGDYQGNLTSGEMLAQIDHAVADYPEGWNKTLTKFKVQFARMGEPALNQAVLEALSKLPERYNATGLIPCIATIAPARSKSWFDKLIDIRHSAYAQKPFQLQLSINSTDEKCRQKMMPASKLSFDELSSIADRFVTGGPRKVGLNFAFTSDTPLEPKVIADHFNPESCCIKITPLNPTERSQEHGFRTALPPAAPTRADLICQEFGELGFDVIVSIGDERENVIGSNCGFAVKHLRDSGY